VGQTFCGRSAIQHDSGVLGAPGQQLVQKYLSANSQPFVLVTGFNCEVAAPGKNRWAKAALRGWTLGGILRYSSGMPILIPTANNALNSLLFRNTSSATFANRVPGQPLFLKDLNCHCFRSEHDFCAEP
jgi:hypothetical protein